MKLTSYKVKMAGGMDTILRETKHVSGELVQEWKGMNEVRGNQCVFWFIVVYKRLGSFRSRTDIFIANGTECSIVKIKSITHWTEKSWDAGRSSGKECEDSIRVCKIYSCAIRFRAGAEIPG